MEVHKLKPFHGWRELAKEVAIIVLGVLIALSAEQVVDALHWRHKMTDLRAAMRQELTADDAPEAYFREATHDCLERYLDNMQTLAESGADRIKLSMLAENYPGYGAAEFTWDMEGWRSLLAADGAAHMAPSELNMWNVPYIGIPQLEHFGQDEREAIIRLQSIRPTPGPMSPQELESLAQTLQRLRGDNDWIANYTAFFFHGLQGAGLKPDNAGMDALEHSKAKAAFNRSMAMAHIGGCEIKPDIDNPHLIDRPSMAPAVAAPRA